MKPKKITRRDWMIRTATGVAAGAVSMPTLLAQQTAPPGSVQQLAVPAGAQQVPGPVEPPTPQDANRDARMKWWHEAQFGMFIHWGLYSQVGRHEWAFENEAFPMTEYEPLAKTFKPRPMAARQSVAVSSHPQRSAMVFAIAASRPQISLRLMAKGTS